MLLKGCGSIPKEAVKEVFESLKGCWCCVGIWCLIFQGVLGNDRQQYHGQVVLHVFTSILGFELCEPLIEFFGRLADHLFIPCFDFDPVGPVSDNQVDWN